MFRHNSLAENDSTYLPPHLESRGFYGKFRATVADNLDPLGLGRLRLKFETGPDYEISGWALPAFPYAGNSVGMVLIPPNGAWVWAEFEDGNPDHPIWTGCFWPTDGKSVPPGPKPIPLNPQVKKIVTDSASIELTEAAGTSRIVIKVAGFELTIDPAGLQLKNNTNCEVSITPAQISLSADLASVRIKKTGTVSINDTALEVT
jgi:hypothetical protein